MKRRIHHIQTMLNHDAPYIERELNKLLTASERIVHIEAIASGVYVFTEDLGLGPR